MRLLTIFLACSAVIHSSAGEVIVVNGGGAQKQSEDLDMGTIKKLLDMASLTAPPSLNYVPINNETRLERQRDVATSEEPFLLSEANFHEYVIDSETHELILERPWFLLFYAPWCGFSQKFTPIWKDFHSKNKELVNIGSIDCSA